MINKDEIKELKELQPFLNVYRDQIRGIFILSAQYDKKSRRLQYGQSQKSSLSYIKDSFKIQINITENGYPMHIFDVEQKIHGWKKYIPVQYWHVNRDGSLCLGVHEEIIKLFYELPYAKLINHLLTSYFYYMSYVRMKQKEPWDGHRHDRFFWLETQIKAEDELDARLLELCLRGIMQAMVAPINQLQKINNHDTCPFCILQNISKKK